MLCVASRKSNSLFSGFFNDSSICSLSVNAGSVESCLILWLRRYGSLTKSVNISDYVSSRNYTKKNNPINPFGSNLNKLAGFGMRR